MIHVFFVLLILNIVLAISFGIFQKEILGIFLIITLISTTGVLIAMVTTTKEEPLTIEQQHQQLKQNIIDDNKELAKFYIDHPELKEENNETGTYK